MQPEAPLIASVTLNPALDLTFQVHGVLAGETTRARPVRRDPSGKGSSVSRAVLEYGGRTVAAVLFGGRTGELAGCLADEGLPVAVSSTAPETRQNVIIRVGAAGAASVWPRDR